MNIPKTYLADIYSILGKRIWNQAQVTTIASYIQHIQFFHDAGISHEEDLRNVAVSLRYLHLPENQVLYDNGDKSE